MLSMKKLQAQIDSLNEVVDCLRKRVFAKPAKNGSAHCDEMEEGRKVLLKERVADSILDKLLHFTACPTCGCRSTALDHITSKTSLSVRFCASCGHKLAGAEEVKSRSKIDEQFQSAMNKVDVAIRRHEAKMEQDRLWLLEKLRKEAATPTFKPCPFCGSELISVCEHMTNRGQAYYLGCKHCLAQGPTFHSLREETVETMRFLRVARWNTRAIVESGEGEEDRSNRCLLCHKDLSANTARSMFCVKCLHKVCPDPEAEKRIWREEPEFEQPFTSVSGKGETPKPHPSSRWCLKCKMAWQRAIASQRCPSCGIDLVSLDVFKKLNPKLASPSSLPELKAARWCLKCEVSWERGDGPDVCSLCGMTLVDLDIFEAIYPNPKYEHVQKWRYRVKRKTIDFVFKVPA